MSNPPPLPPPLPSSGNTPPPLESPPASSAVAPPPRRSSPVLWLVLGGFALLIFISVLAAIAVPLVNATIKDRESAQASRDSATAPVELSPSRAQPSPSPNDSTHTLNSQTPSATPANPSHSTTGDDGTTVNIVDPVAGLTAAAIRFPAGWSAQQQFGRVMESNSPNPKFLVVGRSGDGRSEITLLPDVVFIYMDGPMASQQRSLRRQVGMPEFDGTNDLPPMSPLAYLQHRLLPQLSQSGLQLENLRNPQEGQAHASDSGQESSGSVDASLNGANLRLFCEIRGGQFQFPGQPDTMTLWVASVTIAQTQGTLEPIAQAAEQARQSWAWNPQWIETERAMQTRNSIDGMQRNQRMRNQAHEQAMANIQNFGEANTRRFNERMAEIGRNGERFAAQMDQSSSAQRAYVDVAIRGVSQYQNPQDGSRVEVPHGSGEVYQSTQDPNIYLQSPTPLQDSSSSQWQQLEQVPYSDY